MIFLKGIMHVHTKLYTNIYSGYLVKITYERFKFYHVFSFLTGILIGHSKFNGISLCFEKNIIQFSQPIRIFHCLLIYHLLTKTSFSLDLDSI